jgi:hypothetical protein
MDKKPIYTRLAFPPEELENLPKGYGWNTTEKLGSIHNELGWRLVDFCRIHQIVYRDINKSNRALSEIEIEPFTDNIEDEENLSISRRMDFVIGKDYENKRITNFVDHMTVVGLWAISEQFIGKIYRAYISEVDNIDEDSIPTPYRWNDFLTKFSEKGINLENCDSYSDANECRALNNAIKHNPKVTDRLTEFAFFSDLLGKDLERIELEMQRYCNGISELLGSLIDKTSEIIKNVP